MSKQNTGSKVGYVVFDFDGVIVDSMPLQRDAWKRAMAGVHPSVSQAQKSVILKNFWLGLSGARIFEGTDLPKQTMEELRERKDKHWEHNRLHVEPMPGAIDTLKQLQRIVPLAISSSSPREYIDPLIARLGIEKLFEVIVTDNDVDRPKPSPAALFEISARSGVSSDRFIVVGDTTTDKEMAEAAGSRFILLGINQAECGGSGQECAVSSWPKLLNIVSAFANTR